MPNLLHDFCALISELESTNSSTEKQSILSRYPQCQPLLRWALDPYRMFGVTSDMLKKRLDLESDDISHILDSPSDWLERILSDLSTRKITGHLAIGTVNLFVKKFPEYQEIVYRIIDKDLKCKTAEGVVNGVWPGLIPEFPVALAKDYWDFSDKMDWESGRWYWSRKLDGVRCLTRIEGQEVTFFSREGHQFLTLDRLKVNIIDMHLDNCVLDGEICLLDRDGRETFQGVMTQIRKKNHTIENPAYILFDCLTLEEFDSGRSMATLAERWKRISHVAVNRVVNLVQHPIFVQEEMIVALDNGVDKHGWEGLILRKDVPYEGKRTWDMLKVKKMKDAEYMVQDITTGLVDDGRGNKIMGLTAAVIEHKGFKVQVGSGWTMAERVFYFEHPAELNGKMITVKYFEETKNKKGELSLRFPIVKWVHGDGRKV